MKLNKTKQPIILQDVEVCDAAAEGMSIVKVDGMVVFVPFVVPGDIIDLKIHKKKKNFAEGRALAIKQPSPLRTDAQCPHFGSCGGCKWQTLQYNKQLEYKQKQVRDNLERLGGIDTTPMRPICGSDNIFYYRNKLEYTFSTRRWVPEGTPFPPADDPGALGFHIPTLFDKVLPIEHCALQAEPSNAIRLAIRDYAIEHQLPFYDIRNHTGYLRNLVLRNSSIGQWMVILVVAEDKPEWLLPLLDFVAEKFPQITSLQYIINTKFNDSYSDLSVVTYRGQDHIEEQMEGYNGAPTLHFTINPKSFYQTNSLQARKLYGFVAELADLKPHETVYDLYTGAGTIALFVAAQCKEVVGIEYVEEAIADAKVNAEANNLHNTQFYAGDMADVLNDDFIATHGRPDVVITDPPRAGMHAKVVDQLLKTAPQRIVYVSCNPATQARDLQLLSVQYDIRTIQPVDMFPHTQHVENVVLLVKKEANPEQ